MENIRITGISLYRLGQWGEDGFLFGHQQKGSATATKTK